MISDAQDADRNRSFSSHAPPAPCIFLPVIPTPQCISHEGSWPQSFLQTLQNYDLNESLWIAMLFQFCLHERYLIYFVLYRYFMLYVECCLFLIFPLQWNWYSVAILIVWAQVRIYFTVLKEIKAMGTSYAPNHAGFYLELWEERYVYSHTNPFKDRP